VGGDRSETCSFDRSQFLQKMIGDGTTGEILKQLDEIDEAERDFQSK
jgi:hypothetical protein